VAVTGFRGFHEFRFLGRPVGQYAWKLQNTADHPRTARKTADHRRIQVFILYVTLCRWRTQS